MKRGVCVSNKIRKGWRYFFSRNVQQSLVNNNNDKGFFSSIYTVDSRVSDIVKTREFAYVPSMPAVHKCEEYFKPTKINGRIEMVVCTNQFKFRKIERALRSKRTLGRVWPRIKGTRYENN